MPLPSCQRCGVSPSIDSWGQPAECAGSVRFVTPKRFCFCVFFWVPRSRVNYMISRCTFRNDTNPKQILPTHPKDRPYQFQRPSNNMQTPWRTGPIYNSPRAGLLSLDDEISMIDLLNTQTPSGLCLCRIETYTMISNIVSFPLLGDS